MFGFPMWELLQAGQHGKNLIVGPLVYLIQEIMIVNPFLAPIWIAGFVCLLLWARFRFLGIAFAVMMAEMILFHGKHYYPGDIYPIVIAAGAVQIESWTASVKPARFAVAVYTAVFAR